MGGQTLSESEQIVTGFVLVIEAPSLEVAQAFVAGSPYAQAGTFAESHIRPWNWLTGTPWLSALPHRPNISGREDHKVCVGWSRRYP